MIPFLHEIHTVQIYWLPIFGRMQSVTAASHNRPKSIPKLALSMKIFEKKLLYHKKEKILQNDDLHFLHYYTINLI